ncbi:NAD(P)H-hydrate dehydratase [Orrella daihaiensis]|uniref:ADP-dependent (S)-NAD(P)H-hydrate dehydratase n=1 Tax=Orrella daihaiensis TaxID=2782176 RepID=A0ABY4AIW5_9BURK|nr:NAD(P)H-hydrate dehydratase [Orrella daihaiensis]UOD50235.1 NAD(P)H-hydrate dehydratase [Orrella daihaiensis]
MSKRVSDLIDPSQFAQIFAVRDPAGHKGSFGSSAIVGGAPSMVGAAVLAGRAALKSGCGRVYVGLAQESVLFDVDVGQPELMWRALDALIDISEQITAWGVGCGLGDSNYGLQCLKAVFSHRAGSPLVIDADALNALARGDVSATWGQGSVVLTPHPAEAARLLNTDVSSVQADRIKAAQTLAARFNAWVVLKGQHTVICRPDGQCQTNTTGNVGLATAGSGDVLTGLLTSLLAQGFTTEVAVPAAVWLHGKAADELVAQLGGPIGLTASELIDTIRKLRNTLKPN